MTTYRVTNKQTGLVLFEGQAESAEDALLKTAADIGGWEPSVYDSTAPHPEMRHFDSIEAALKVFVPEAIADIEIVQ